MSPKSNTGIGCSPGSKRASGCRIIPNGKAVEERKSEVVGMLLRVKRAYLGDEFP